MPEQFHVRQATPADAAVIAWHRARMFQDMGQLPPAAVEPLRSQAESYLRGALERREYVGWLASSASTSEIVVAGAGVQRRQGLPHPRRRADGEVAIAEGRHGLVLNVFTEPEWRRQGVATLLMRAILDWAQWERLDQLVLHASDEGRALYQQLGFVPTNEMRFARAFDEPR